MKEKGDSKKPKAKVIRTKSGLRVSEAALGAMTFGEDWGWGAAKDEARKVYETYREAGGNLIDTANVSRSRDRGESHDCIEYKCEPRE